jgi:serine/threonine protein kinase
MQSQDGDNLGKLLVSLLVIVFAAAFGTIVLTLWTAVRWIRQIKYAKAAIEAEPAFDPTLTEHMIEVSLLKMSRVLGQGAEGIVREAEYMGNAVAVKIVRLVIENYGTQAILVSNGPDAMPLADGLHKAEAEAQMMFPLRHPNIVAFYGIAVSKSSYEISLMVVMELCVRSAQDLVLDHSMYMGWKEKVDLLFHMAQGMAYLHSRGIIHRDLKLGNVLIDEKQVAKIADFGMSRKMERADEVDEVLDMTTNIGTPVYMAPELLSADSTTETIPAMIDVYSFGVLMWAVMTRERPFEREMTERSLNIWALRGMIVEGARPDVDGTVLDTAPSALIKLMERCWHTDPFCRPSGFAEVQDKLSSVRHMTPHMFRGDTAAALESSNTGSRIGSSIGSSAANISCISIIDTGRKSTTTASWGLDPTDSGRNPDAVTMVNPMIQSSSTEEVRRSVL